MNSRGEKKAKIPPKPTKISANKNPYVYSAKDSSEAPIVVGEEEEK